MSTAQALQQATLRVTITIQAGPDKGSSYQLLPPMALIGRGAENDIVLTDTRCSRQQAVIRFENGKVEIEDVSSRKTTLLNGQPAKTSALNHGDTITMGATELIFRLEMPTPAPAVGPNLAVVQPFTAAPPLAAPLAIEPSSAFEAPALFQAGPAPQERHRPAATDNTGRVRFYIMVAVIGAVLFYLVQHGQNKDLKDKFTLRSSADVEKDIKTSEVRLEEVAKKRFKSPEAKQRFEEAQTHYLTGFRDYEKGQYSRALRSFETARAIDPSHELANRYSVLAERKRDEAITSNMVDGRRYKEKRMFSRCSAALDKVLDEISNPDDIRYKESSALKRECDLMLEGTY
jgi:pSer/pThr/pTyr-binding forkhead associated (FHA) protein